PCTTLRFLSFSLYLQPDESMFVFSFYCNGDHRDLHSFPTRRSSDLPDGLANDRHPRRRRGSPGSRRKESGLDGHGGRPDHRGLRDRKSTRLNSSHEWISYAVFCLKKKKSHV